MRTKIPSVVILAAAFVVLAAFMSPATPDAYQVVKKASQNRFGNNSFSIMRMQIIRPKWKRTIEMKSWSMGDDYSLVLITAPAKEKGQVFLKRKKEMWNYIPRISRMIKLPPSMMSQGWMGSDYSNDDIINQNSLLDNYTHKIVGSESIDGRECYKIESVPKEDADIVWGKKISWISKEGFWVLKSQSYDDDGLLVRTETASQIKAFGKKKLPSLYTVVPADEEGHKTVFELLKIDFDIKIDEKFFSQANMKRVR